MSKRRTTLVQLLAGALLCWVTPVAQATEPVPPLPLLELESGSLPWGDTAEWELANESFEGNPFDLVATVTFTHATEGDSVTTEMYYAGGERWRFRFTGTLIGTWRFTTSATDPDLDGHTGRVTVVEAEPTAHGFLETDGNKLVVTLDNGRLRRGVAYNVFVASQDVFQSVADLSDDPAELERQVAARLDETEANGFNSFFVPVNNSWFSFGTSSYEEHESVDPDPVTFAVLETLIRQAHRRGMFIHIWAWGDERRRWTAKGVEGGINGEADRRLQRYIAARLAPLPGWTMAYGFDLEEWVEPAEVLSWGAFLHERSGWPPLLTAREYGEFEGRSFTLGDRKLDIFSTDDRPEGEFYSLARERLEQGLPVLFERRFVYRRDGVWDTDTSRRAMWQFAMAGGAGSVWGIMFDDPTPYPHPEQFRIHREFWKERLLPDIRPYRAGGPDAEQGAGSDAAANSGGKEDASSTPSGEAAAWFAMATPDGANWIFYAEDTDRVRLDLRQMDSPRRAVVVDARGESYEEIELGELTPGDLVWEAPYVSDWAVAVGFGE